MTQTKELVLDSLVVVDLVLHQLDVLFALDYFPLPHGDHSVRLRQIYDNLLKFFELFSVDSVVFVVLGVVSFREDSAQLYDPLVLFVLRLLTLLKLAIIEFLGDVQLGLSRG